MFTDAPSRAASPSPAAPSPAATPQADPASLDAPSQPATGPRTPTGKAVSARNATTHGLFARDIVLPALGEDPHGYQQVADELTEQLRPGNILERHYVEKIAAASWRLRRLHHWQAQLFEDDALTEDARLDKLDKVLRHENHLHRQIDTAVKMLNKDVPQLYTRRVRDQVLLDMMLSERECRESARDETEVDLETRGRLRRIRKATEAAVGTLSHAPLDTAPAADCPENCQNEPPPEAAAPTDDEDLHERYREPRDARNCRNEPAASAEDARRAFLASFPHANGPTPATSERSGPPRFGG